MKYGGILKVLSNYSESQKEYEVILKDTSTGHEIIQEMISEGHIEAYDAFTGETIDYELNIFDPRKLKINYLPKTLPLKQMGISDKFNMILYPEIIAY